jgi:hypothetical protein
MAQSIWCFAVQSILGLLHKCMARPPGMAVTILGNAPLHADATKRAAYEGTTNGELPAKEAAGLRQIMSARIA